MVDLTELAAQILASPARARRKLVAVAGPPASGKSTLAEALSAQVPNSCVVPMDGFHLDNPVLETRGLLGRKGCPDSFDVAGFRHLVARLAVEDEVVYPKFDRSTDRAIAGAGVVASETGTVIVEGNYLLLDKPGWRELSGFWDNTVHLDVPMEVLEERLVQRWTAFGFAAEDALAKARLNDLPNAELVAAKSCPAQITVKNWG